MTILWLEINSLYLGLNLFAKISIVSLILIGRQIHSVGKLGLYFFVWLSLFIFYCLELELGPDTLKIDKSFDVIICRYTLLRMHNFTTSPTAQTHLVWLGGQIQ